MRQGRQLLVGPTSVVDDARERHWEPATSRLISGCACITTVQHVASKSHRYCAHSRKPIPVLRRRCAQRTCRSAMDACSACNIVGSKLTGCFVRQRPRCSKCSVWKCAIRDPFVCKQSTKQQCQQDGPQHQQQLLKNCNYKQRLVVAAMLCWPSSSEVKLSLVNTLRRLQHTLLLDAAICRLTGGRCCSNIALARVAARQGSAGSIHNSCQDCATC